MKSQAIGRSKEEEKSDYRWINGLAQSCLSMAESVPLFSTLDDFNKSPLHRKIGLQTTTVDNSIFIQEAKVKEGRHLTNLEKRTIVVNIFRSNNGLIRSICLNILENIKSSIS